MSDPNAVTEVEFAVWERELHERAAADKERNAWKSAGPKGTEHLIVRILQLEDALFLKQVALEAVAEMLNDRARDLKLARREVAVLDRMVQALLAESAAPRLRAAA